MGNSEVGHLNIGAGRIVYQDIVRIDMAIDNDTLATNETVEYVMDTSRLHLIGLVSDGGVHSHIRHLKALLGIAKERGVKQVFVHFIADGRDTAPTSALKYLDELQKYLDALGSGARIATVQGRYWAMDRDKRWERTERALECLLGGEGARGTMDDLNQKYAMGETDEFWTPVVLDGEGTIRGGDSILFFNFRSDRMRQLVDGLRERLPVARMVSMTRYKDDHQFPVISPPQLMDNVMAEWISKQALHQLHVAETEKYAHVTFFFNGGRETSFEGEERTLIASPKVATYDLAPPMSSLKVAERVAEQVRRQSFEFMMCNLAPPDMVGHTGQLQPTIEAVEATDSALGLIYDACLESDVVLVITADHGNAEQMLDDEGHPHTAHTCNPVPLIVYDPRGRRELRRDGGALCDVAPTVLEVMGIAQPGEMTGSSLIVV